MLLFLRRRVWDTFSRRCEELCCRGAASKKMGCFFALGKQLVGPRRGHGAEGLCVSAVSAQHEHEGTRRMKNRHLEAPALAGADSALASIALGSKLHLFGLKFLQFQTFSGARKVELGCGLQHIKRSRNCEHVPPGKDTLVDECLGISQRLQVGGIHRKIYRPQRFGLQVCLD